ncbi:MAG TPA: AAA family ATPase [Candidatus Paceibacterota bacterium]
MNNQSELACIRCGTEHSLTDATALASRILKIEKTSLDSATFEFSKDLFVAVAMEVAHSEENATFNDMLAFLVDPEWDSTLQMLHFFGHSDKVFQRDENAHWIKRFIEKLEDMSNDRAERLVKRCHIHWKAAMNASCAGHRKQSKPRASIQVFNPDAVSCAIDKCGGLKYDKKSASARIFEDAQTNNGYRTVPNARKAGKNLEAARHQFENLVEPIGRLQTGFVLASCMKPADFRITPLLLLGEPGIGKTYLATQLARSLGVPMEKMSAGGAQGGFQLTGSHPSWIDARPGSLVTLLASGESASPVIVIDEVDKIRDSKYPVLPVLLDLMEPETGKHFKDEYLEMEFDASRIIFVLTANSLEGVPESLLSRCEVFNVPRPEPVQRLRIIEAMGNKLRMKTGRSIELDKGTSRLLAERMDIDLRQVTFLVEGAFAKAIQTGNRVGYIWTPEGNKRADDSAHQGELTTRMLH